MQNDLYNPEQFLVPACLSLEELLRNRLFVVPSYQRDYAWKSTEQVEELWCDVSDVVRRSWTDGGMLVPVRRPHFFGPVVVQQSGDAHGEFELMDGQQRLVTFSILLSVLVEHVELLSSSESRDAWSGTLKSLLFTFVNGARRPIIRLGRSAEVFEALFCDRFTDADRQLYIAQIPAKRPAEVAMMLAAYHTLRDRVSAFLATPGNGDAVTLRLVRSVLGLSVFLLMRVREKGVAYEVFEGLNARGLELSQADLIKNRVFALAESQSTLQTVEAAWENALESIRGQSMISMTEFLHYHHLVFHEQVHATDLYNRIERETLDKVGALTYAKSVADAALRLQTTLDAATLSDDGGRHVAHIRDSLGNKFALLLILASTGRIQDVESAEFVSLLQLSHHYAFRRFILAEASLSTYSSEVAGFAREFAGEQLSLRELADAMRAKAPDGQLRSRFSVASARTHKEGFYVCDMIETYLGKGGGVVVQPQNPSQHLEHIYPKRPRAGDWPQVSPEELSLNVNRFGNLLILEGDRNRHIKNKSFAYKASNNRNLDYAGSAMKLPHQLAPFLDTTGQWTLESISKRQDYLASQYSVLVWPLSV